MYQKSKEHLNLEHAMTHMATCVISIVDDLEVWLQTNYISRLLSIIHLKLCSKWLE